MCWLCVCVHTRVYRGICTQFLPTNPITHPKLCRNTFDGEQNPTSAIHTTESSSSKEIGVQLWGSRNHGPDSPCHSSHPLLSPTQDWAPLRSFSSLGDLSKNSIRKYRLRRAAASKVSKPLSSEYGPLASLST